MLAATISLASVGTYANWTTSLDATTGTVSTGTVEVSLDGASSMSTDVLNVAPGDSIQRLATFRNSGSIELSQVTLAAAGSADDPWTARLRGGTVWRTTRVVPYLGGAVTALHRLKPRILLLWSVCAVGCGWTLRRIWRTPTVIVPDTATSALVPPWLPPAAPSTVLVPAWPAP